MTTSGRLLPPLTPHRTMTVIIPCSLGRQTLSLKGMGGICSPKEFHILKELWQALCGFQNSFILHLKQASTHSGRKGKPSSSLGFENTSEGHLINM